MKTPARRKPQRPSEVIAGRLRRFRREATRRKVSALLITNPQDYLYLTGFSGEDSAVLLTGRAVHVITDGRFSEVVRTECPWATTWIRRGTLNAKIAEVCKSQEIRALAVQSDHLCVSGFAELAKLTGIRRLRSAPPILADMRKIKQPAELTTMRKAIRIAEGAFAATRASIRIGQTELELAARLEFEMKKRGSSAPAFPTICAEGPNAALPHAHPGQRKVRKGSAILFDWGARWRGYCSDLTRMVFIGSIPRKIAEVYDVVLEAQQKAIAAIRPGRRMCDVDAEARDFIAAAGYGEAFCHGLGHGLGLDVHEPPSLSWRSKEKLEAGMVVTVEPGVYLPGVGGVRIEDDVLVTPQGRRVLSRLGRSSGESVLSPVR
ncbi:MAG: aminopeptidase P family protein [Planctomycetes bacterium]|nr:aminopeptidase P family protein [Planctomycetota bacterium]